MGYAHMHPQSEVTALLSAADSDGRLSDARRSPRLTSPRPLTTQHSSLLAVLFSPIVQRVASYARYAQLDDLLQYLPEDAADEAASGEEDQAEISFA